MLILNIARVEQRLDVQGREKGEYEEDLNMSAMEDIETIKNILRTEVIFAQINHAQKVSYVAIKVLEDSIKTEFKKETS